jgi:hypothetical protein
MELSKISVDMKVLIEQMREQVQNLEWLWFVLSCWPEARP